MSFIICTLFEGHYHYGVAALANSCYNNGYRGVLYAGYKGVLPSWANAAKENTAVKWKDCYTLKIKNDFNIHFLPLDTDYHLTNYKPQFFLTLLSNVVAEAEGLIYFDPDIVIKCKWQFFEKWANAGVALVHEIVSNDMPATHPIRLEWEQIIVTSGKSVNRQIHSYINGGFCGIARKHIDFLYQWKDIINIAIDQYGCDPLKFSSFDRTYPFWSIDQDALNVVAMCCECPISEMGPEAMDFIGAGWTMSHATGAPKPWKKNFTTTFLNGRLPSKTDKLFWQQCSHPIKVFSKSIVSYKNFFIRLYSFLGRFYKRN